MENNKNRRKGVARPGPDGRSEFAVVIHENDKARSDRAIAAAKKISTGVL